MVRLFVYFHKRNKMPSTQLVPVIYLIWLQVSTSEGHLQTGGVKYIKENVYNRNYDANVNLIF